MSSYLERRECDHLGDGHTSPCKNLMVHTELETNILVELNAIRQGQTLILTQQESMKEMLEAWNNTKGFVTTIKTAGKLILWLVAIGAAWAIVTETMKHWLATK